MIWKFWRRSGLERHPTGIGHEFQIDSLVAPRWINKWADLVGVEFAALPKALGAQYRTDRLVHWHDADLKDSVS